MLLLLPSISPANLKLAGILLTFFYEQHTPLYGPKFSVMNIHNVDHYVRAVIRLGPLWANSCFIYENKNGKITSQITGTYQIVLGVHFLLSS